MQQQHHKVFLKLFSISLSLYPFITIFSICLRLAETEIRRKRDFKNIHAEKLETVQEGKNRLLSEQLLEIHETRKI